MVRKVKQMEHSRQIESDKQQKRRVPEELASRVDLRGFEPLTF